MSKEYILSEFKKCLEENPSNLDREYLSQIKLEIIDFSEKDSFYNLTYKLHGFNYDNEGEERSVSTFDQMSFGLFLYNDIVTWSDLMRKNEKVRQLIDEAGKEADRILKKRDRLKFWLWFIPGKSRSVRMGDCHIAWNEQKRILKEKYNIDWKTPSERNPDVRFD